MSSHPIGIFDSGIGGLTVFREIARILPNESLLYLGDTARVPYGTKSAATVLRYALQNVRFLLEKNVKMVVVACNTASAFALEEVQKQFTIPVIGVIEPGVAGALKSSSSKRIGIIGTEGTIASSAYSRSILSKDPSSFVTSAACPLFVPLVEEGWWETSITEEIAQTYLGEMLKARIDTLILGCTHYPLLKRTLRKVAGETVTLIDSAEETARAASALLTEKNLMAKENRNPRREFFVTDSPERFQKMADLFLKQDLRDVHHVEI